MAQMSWYHFSLLVSSGTFSFICHKLTALKQGGTSRHHKSPRMSQEIRGALEKLRSWENRAACSQITESLAVKKFAGVQFIRVSLGPRYGSACGILPSAELGNI